MKGAFRVAEVSQYEVGKRVNPTVHIGTGSELRTALLGQDTYVDFDTPRSSVFSKGLMETEHRVIHLLSFHMALEDLILLHTPRGILFLYVGTRPCETFPC